MTAAFRPITRLIAAILLLQVVLAPAHCLAMAATSVGLEAVLCSADGTRTIHLGPDGQELPAHEASQGVCVVCTGLAHAALPQPPMAPTPAWTAAGLDWHAAGTETLPPPARAPPYRPTGPPTLS